MKSEVPDHIKEQAREMARQELARRLEELNMTNAEAKGYGALLEAVQSHIAILFDLLESKLLHADLTRTILRCFIDLAAKEEERVWRSFEGNSVSSTSVPIQMIAE